MQKIQQRLHFVFLRVILFPERHSSKFVTFHIFTWGYYATESSHSSRALIVRRNGANFITRMIKYRQSPIANTRIIPTPIVDKRHTRRLCVVNGAKCEMRLSLYYLVDHKSDISF